MVVVLFSAHKGTKFSLILVAFGASVFGGSSG
jgi:hypothetical protein